MMVVLELQEQLANVRRVTVRHDIVIGRGSDCNLRLSAAQISRRHCFLRVGRDGVSVTDLDSSNGTYVDKQRINPGARVQLVTGSILSLGPVSFTVHVKEDPGSTTNSDGERSRKSSKAGRGVSESSTIVSSAASIIPEEFRSKTALQYSVEQGGASAEPDEETARVMGGRANDAAVSRPPSVPALSNSPAEVADIAVPAARKAVAVALISPVVAPVSEMTAKSEPTNPSSISNRGAENFPSRDSHSLGAESFPLTDDSPDDLSFFGGMQNEDILAPPEGSTISPAIEVVDDVLEKAIEVPDDEDLFDEPVEAIEVVEVLDDEPVEIVEVLDEDSPANALTADFEQSDLLDEQFLEVLDDPELLAEEVVEVEAEIEAAEELKPASEIEAVEEVWDFAEVAAEDIVMADDESPDEAIAENVVEVAEEDEESNWFSVGDDKADDDDDPELRKFLKGF